jgi:hypothetical protein
MHTVQQFLFSNLRSLSLAIQQVSIMLTVANLTFACSRGESLKENLWPHLTLNWPVTGQGGEPHV